MNENLFEIFRRSFPADLGRDLPRAARRQRAQLRRPARPVGPGGPGAQGSGREARRPCRGPGREERRGAHGLSRRACGPGAVYLPLNTAYTAGEIRYFLGDAEPTLFVCRPEQQAQMQGLASELGVPQVLTLGEHGEGSLMGPVEAATAGDVDVPRGQDDLAAILYTSGTTGPLQGCHAEPRQPRLERRGLARGLALHRRRPAAARACRSSTPTACSSPPTSP